MRFSESWLRTFVNPALTTEELAHALTMGGLEVESLTPAAPPFKGIVVGQIISFGKHPNADRLNVCQVDIGSGPALNIVCGAPNVAAGMKVPCAIVGAELPGETADKPFVIKQAKMRGVESQGMLCSARELGMSDDHTGLLPLAADAPLGQNVRELLKLDDTVFEVKLTPNKADALSVFGVAREVAAMTGAALTSPIFVPAAVKLADKLPVKISATNLCGRFSGRVIRGLNARAATPVWMVERLEKSGQRSISALVDISNYVMFELGRPSHVFDLDKIHGGLEVRWGRPGEQLKLLNGNTVAVDAWVGVIADEKEIESLAGIMGGDSTAVSLDTSNIYLEAAFWWPEAIAGRGRKYNFSTDAGHRFERGVDFATTVDHLERITQLILEICGGEAGPVDDQAPNLPQRLPVHMRTARCHKVLGRLIPESEIGQIFQRLGFAFVQERGGFTVTPPSFRFDLEIEEDLIEEVARIHGFDKIEIKPPVAAAAMFGTPEARRSVLSVKEALAARDYQEVVNMSFVDDAWERDFAQSAHAAQPIRLLNPIASQMGVMRSTLLGSLVANVKYNLNRKAARVRVFEAGKVFFRDSTAKADGIALAGYRQPLFLGAAACGPAEAEQWGIKPLRPVDFFDVKSDLESLLPPNAEAVFVRAAHPALHPGRAAQVLVNGLACGWIGELHPKWLQSYDLPQPVMLFEIDMAALTARGLPQIGEVSKFPPVIRDAAFLVPARISAQAALDVLFAAAEPCVASIDLFDDYRLQRGAGVTVSEKSLAFRVLMQDTQTTLTDEQADQVMQKLVIAMHEKLGAQLRR